MFPDLKRGLIIVSSIENDLKNDAIQRMLTEEIEERKGTSLADHEFIKTWDEAHRRFGSNPNKFSPSIKSLLKRIQKGGSLPFVNEAVALFNYISIKYLVPCGGDDVERIEGNLTLGFAGGEEEFVSLGSKEKETPSPREVIYFDDKTLRVMCRRWNWRNGDFTKITEDTKKLVINIDGIGPVSKELIEEARDVLARALVERCGATVQAGYIDIDHRERDLDL